jgi:hypothetical protein
MQLLRSYNGGRSSDAMLAFLKGKLEGDKVRRI